MMGGAKTGLAHARIEPEVADQLLGTLEAGDIADRRHQPGRHRQIDAGDREQSPDRRVIQRALGDLPVKDREILAKPIELAHMPLDREPLIVGHRLARQPVPAAAVEQIGMRTLRDQVRVQDRVHLVLDPRPMPHDLIAPRDQPRIRSVSASGVQISGR